MDERDFCTECLRHHAAYPHEPGTLHDCYACETHHHESAGEACVCDVCTGFDYV